MQPYTNRNFPPGAATAPAISAARRGPGPMLPASQPSLTAQQMHAQQQAELQAQAKKIEDAKNRSRKPVDRNLPDGLDEIVIGDGLQQYKNMRDVERRLDAVMTRKRLDVQDSVQRGPKQYGTMRVWVSNTCENQPWQAGGMDPHAFDFSSNVEATFKVKIEGRLINTDGEDDPSDDKENGDTTTDVDDQATTDEASERPSKRARLSGPIIKGRKKFSHFFKSITIDFDRPRTYQPDGYTQIKWVRPDAHATSQIDPPREADFDCLEFERKADENINVTINMVPDEQPERYKLSKPLAELLDVEEADRQTVLMGIWEYIKAAGLQGDDEHRRIICDDQLRAIFNTDSFLFQHVPELIRPYLFDPPPLTLPYTIRVDKAFHTSTPPHPATIYDIPIPLPSPLLSQLRTLTTTPSHTATLTSIARLDDKLALLVQAMNHSKAKHAFLTSMGRDPAGFVRRWISSQKRDLDVITGAGSWGEEEWKGEEWRRGGGAGVWGSREAWEGVGSFLSRGKV